MKQGMPRGFLYATQWETHSFWGYKWVFKIQKIKVGKEALREHSAKV